jgi:sugar O-acyltransferase (sialic acid O-acetyltransferase NeuD family)
VRDLVILGTDVHALEMVEIVERTNRLAPTWRLRGYVTTDPGKVGADLNGYPVLGTQGMLDQLPEACFLPAYGEGWALPTPRERLVSLIDPGVWLSRTAQIGLGSVIYPNCFVGLNARIGDYLFCLSGCIINHDVVIEDRVVMASGVSLAGGVHVEADCYLGQASTCREGLRIGHGSLIGMGAVVVKDVPPRSVVVGNPARKLRDR